MRVVRCQECEVPNSRYCKKCPNCCARNPAFRRRSPWAMFALALLMALAVFVVKHLKPNEPELSLEQGHPDEMREATLR